MQTITIHYESPADDPLKVPRPHRVDIDRGLPGAPYGGEIGRLRDLIGFCRTTTPSPDRYMSDMRLAAELYDGDVLADDLVGWYAQFIDDDGRMFGYSIPIKRIEVSES